MPQPLLRTRWACGSIFERRSCLPIWAISYALVLQTGLTAGLISALVSMIISAWTMYILAALFLERKRDLVSFCLLA